jgi:hypothetical protein
MCYVGWLRLCQCVFIMLAVYRSTSVNVYQSGYVYVRVAMCIPVYAYHEIKWVNWQCGKIRHIFLSAASEPHNFDKYTYSKNTGKDRRENTLTYYLLTFFPCEKWQNCNLNFFCKGTQSIINFIFECNISQKNCAKFSCVLTVCIFIKVVRFTSST